jgi:hypothetical protein
MFWVSHARMVSTGTVIDLPDFRKPIPINTILKNSSAPLSPKAALHVLFHRLFTLNTQSL